MKQTRIGDSKYIDPLYEQALYSKLLLLYDISLHPCDSPCLKVYFSDINIATLGECMVYLFPSFHF
jgi:hypothetical protein